MPAKRMGRPTDNPKPHRIAARLDEKTKEVLDRYCEQEQVSMMEGVRRGIRKLEEELKDDSKK